MLRTLVALVLLVGATVAASAQWRHERGHWDNRRHWEHQQPRPQPGFDLGGFIGGVIGGMMQPDRDAIADCMRRFRSYNPETGIYYGYDGRPRRCP